MYRFVVDLLQPHTVLFLWACVGLFRQWRGRGDPKRRWWPLLVPLAGLTVLSLPVTAHVALLSLEAPYAPLAERPADAEAIVVFSSGVYPPRGPRLRGELDESSLHRCLEAARLYHQGQPCPVLVSGGKVDEDEPGPSFASVLGEFLEQHGVSKSDLILEENSRTTYENAVESARILQSRKIQQVILVADAVDMYRAEGCLRKQGIELTPAPCRYQATSYPLTVFGFLPNPGAAGQFQRVWHEWLGIVWYKCQGRL